MYPPVFIVKKGNATTGEDVTINEKEACILYYFTEGLNQKDIGDKVCLSKGAVKMHMCGLYYKTGVEPRNGKCLIRWIDHHNIYDEICKVAMRFEKK